jgi:hypothetical protein
LTPITPIRPLFLFLFASTLQTMTKFSLGPIE